MSVITQNNGIASESDRVCASSQRPRIGIFFEENLLNAMKRPGVQGVFRSLIEIAEGLGEIRHRSAHLSFSPRAPIDAGTLRLKSFLGEMGFAVDLKPRGIVAGKEKSTVDPDISFDIGCAVVEKQLDLVILGAGDIDYVNVIGALKSRGVATLVFCPNHRQTSRKLLDAATTYIGLEELWRLQAYAA